MIKYLTKMFNKILKDRVTPDQWGSSDIIVLYKKGDKHNIENYRPISLTPNVSKIFAKFIGNRIKKHPGNPAIVRTGGI